MGRFSIVCMECGNAPCEIAYLNDGTIAGFQCLNCGETGSNMVPLDLSVIAPEMVDAATIAAITVNAINHEGNSEVRNNEDKGYRGGLLDFPTDNLPFI